MVRFDSIKFDFSVLRQSGLSARFCPLSRYLVQLELVRFRSTWKRHGTGYARKDGCHIGAPACGKADGVGSSAGQDYDHPRWARW